MSRRPIYFAGSHRRRRVILALKRRGHVVGFLGDGINDAPSLHTADVGISVDGAVDVAEVAADIILLDRDLEVVERGVSEGRRTFGNIMKYIMMGTSSNPEYVLDGGRFAHPAVPANAANSNPTQQSSV